MIFLAENWRYREKTFFFHFVKTFSFRNERSSMMTAETRGNMMRVAQRFSRSFFVIGDVFL